MFLLNSLRIKGIDLIRFGLSDSKNSTNRESDGVGKDYDILHILQTVPKVTEISLLS